MSDGGKGSSRRPGEGYASGWDAIFGKNKAKPNNSDEKQESADSFKNTIGQHGMKLTKTEVTPNKQPE